MNAKLQKIELIGEIDPSAIVADDSKVNDSPAVEVAIDALALEPADTAAKLAVVKEPPRLDLEAVSEERTDAVERLESLFLPTTSASETVESKSPLADVLASSTSASRPTSPRKDPIEVIDALDEDIAATEASLQAAVNSTSSPAKASGVKFAKSGNPSPPETKPIVRKSSVKARAEARPAVENKSRPSVARSALVKSKDAGKGPSPGTSARARPLREASTPVKGSAVTKVKERSAITALHTPPPVVKSSRPVTKAAFQLPGEAAAERLRVMKDAREKRREEAEQKAKEEKSRPAPKAVAALRPSAIIENAQKRSSVLPAQSSTVRAPRSSVAPSATRTSTVRPRPSVALTRKLVEKESPKAAVVPRVAQLSTASSAARASSIGTSAAPTASGTTKASRPGMTTEPPRAALSSTTANTINRRVTSNESKTSSSSDGKTTSAKGKEVYEREKLVKAANEKAVKERIEAAKKAREEATIRGKAAAKAWAEKNKQKAGPAKRVVEAAQTSSSGAAEGAQEVPALLEEAHVQPESLVAVTAVASVVV